MNWTPARRSLMLHVIEMGGWLDCDSIRVNVQTLRGLEALGIIVLGRQFPKSRPVSATATTEGVRLFLEYWESGAP